jgi:hypothetical protein
VLNHGNTLVYLLYCISLSSCQIESTLPPPAWLLLFQPQQGNLVGHYPWISNVLESLSGRSCELLYATNSCYRKQEAFFYEYPLHWVPLPTKAHKRTLLFGNIPLKHGRHFDYRNEPLNIHMCVCYRDCHEAGLCCYIVVHTETYYAHCSCFIFICDLITDSLVWYDRQKETLVCVRACVIKSKQYNLKCCSVCVTDALRWLRMAWYTHQVSWRLVEAFN